MVEKTAAKDRFADVKPSDALGTLRARAQGSRTAMVIIAVAGVIIAAFIIGLLWRTVTGGIRNAPPIPSVGI